MAKVKRVPGRLIRSWFVQAVGETKSDDEAATKINQLAQKAGHEYKADAAKVKEWKAKEAGAKKATTRKRSSPAAGDGESGFMTELRQAVNLLGKDGVKNLVDSL